MSYEGCEMVLCRNGHFHSWDCYDAPNYQMWLCTCGADLAWFKSIDQTNHGGIWPELVEFAPSRVSTCECCGHTTELEPARYCIPSNYGRAKEERTSVPPALVKFRYAGTVYDTEDEACVAIDREDEERQRAQEEFR